jgi:hypothetical protein
MSGRQPFAPPPHLIRIYRQRFNPATVDNRYTFLDVLTGAVIKDGEHTVEWPVFMP